MDKQQTKQEALEYLAQVLRGQRRQLEDIDGRLLTYYEGLTDGTMHNLYEVLGGIKFLRVLRTYPFSHKRVRHAIQLYEGRWNGDKYIEGSGGLQFSGLKGFTHYQLQPFQVFALAGLLGPMKDVDGDMRRLCTELVLYLTRKSGKTLMSAFIQFYGFFFMDSNFEGYCCANSADQAKLLYKTAQTLIRQMDPGERRIRFTASQTNWKPGQPRQASITALSAGGKTKDGLFAQLCCADEFGSADFTNGKSDMLDLVSVVQSSMGPRREPLTVITTTAGYATNGPFHRQLELMEQSLEEELTLAQDSTEPRPDDFRHALLLQPDPWEQQDENALLNDERIWRKSNPMIGISVQPSFYEQEAYKARQNTDNRKEFITKLVNVYQTGRITKWIKSERIRPLQVERRIEDCKYSDGWNVFCGMDFALGDDLFAITYLAVDYRPSDTMAGRFFSDCDLWVLESTMNDSPNRQLYEIWQQQGWLHVCPGEVFDSTYAINRIAEVVQAGVNILMFGYDPAQSAQPINQLKAWLQTLFQQRGEASMKQLAETIQHMVVPVSQTAMTQNPRIGELEHMILEKEPWLNFSANPMWPWMFGNCAAELNSSDLRRITKGGPQPTHKIDGVAALIDALYCFDLSEGRIESN
jgi:phage terminase large subunit-like protein